MANNLTWLGQTLDEIRGARLWREDRVLEQDGDSIKLCETGETLFNFSSNDYLGLSQDPRVIEALKEGCDLCGAGVGAARLVAGTREIHRSFETEIARWLDTEAALLFGSGYLTNVGVLSSILSRNDIVVTDRYVHASIIDGIGLSRAKLYRYRHNDLDDLRKVLERIRRERKPQTKLVVVTESVFSMDGDLAPLEGMAELADEFNALLMVDEAHAIGVFGRRGAGLIECLGLREKVSLTVGTLSKALGSYGGFVACSNEFRQLFVNCARSFIFSTALPAGLPLAGLAALFAIREEPVKGEKTLKNAVIFRERLKSAGLNTLASASQIVPVVVGENETALEFSRLLLRRGILAVCIRPPTVPAGSSRIRFSVGAAHSESQLIWAADQVIQVAKEMSVRFAFDLGQGLSGY